MDVLTGLLALYGIGMIVWLSASGGKSVLSSLFDTNPKLKPVDISIRMSASGRCHVENEGYDESMKKYVADVVCPELDERSMVVADSAEHLEKKIASLFEHLEWRLDRRKR